MGRRFSYLGLSWKKRAMIPPFHSYCDQRVKLWASVTGLEARYIDYSDQEFTMSSAPTLRLYETPTLLSNRQISIQQWNANDLSLRGWLTITVVVCSDMEE